MSQWLQSEGSPFTGHSQAKRLELKELSQEWLSLHKWLSKAHSWSAHCILWPRNCPGSIPSCSVWSKEEKHALTHFCEIRWLRRSAEANVEHKTWWLVASESIDGRIYILVYCQESSASILSTLVDLYFFPFRPKKRFLISSWPYNCTPYDTGYCTDSGAWDFCLKVSLFPCKIECWPTAELWETQYFVLYWLLIWGLCSAHTHCLGSLLCFTCSSQGFHTYLIFLMVWLALFSWHTN